MPGSMQEHLAELVKRAAEATASAQTVVQLDQVRVQFLGKKGEVTEQLKHGC